VLAVVKEFSSLDSQQIIDAASLNSRKRPRGTLLRIILMNSGSCSSADFVAAIVIPDPVACAGELGLDHTPTYPDLARDERMVALLRERLASHARANPASTRCARRAMLLPVSPSLDRGEITDKGSINQRAILAHHAYLITQLYSASPASLVAVMEPE
jgi:hypothetical protein